MLFSEYADGLRRCNRVDIAGKAQLTLLLGRRRLHAPFDEVMRFGAHELGLLDDVCGTLGITYERPADTSLTRPGQPNHEEARKLGRSPRTVYVTEVMPRIAKGRAGTADARRDIPLRPLEPELAREVSFVVLDGLQASCALAALATEGYDAGSYVDDAVRTAKLATQVFDMMVEPTMLDDWGQEPHGGRPVAISAPHRLVESVRMVYRTAAQDLRLLLAESDVEMGDVATGAWRAHAALFGRSESRASSLAPIWWMRPTYRLSGVFDPIGVPAQRVLEPFDAPADTGVGRDDIETLSLTPSSARGLAAICGMVLARAIQSDAPAYTTRRLRPLGDSIDLAALALLHRELLNAAGLM